MVQLPQDWFGTATWPPFHCFGTANMAAVTSCEKAHVEGTRAVPSKVRHRVVCRQFNAE